MTRSGKAPTTWFVGDKSGMPGANQPVFVECTSMGNLPRVAQNLKFEAMPDKGKAAFEAAEKDGTRAGARVRIGLVSRDGRRRRAYADAHDDAQHRAPSWGCPDCSGDGKPGGVLDHGMRGDDDRPPQDVGRI